jgi:aminoglycoside phosphotransferase (APT) family kinase protein
MTIGNGPVPAGGTTIRGERDDLPLGRLERWMRDHVDGFRGPLAVERFEGGQSNPTYKLASATRTYVLRRKPVGQLLPSAHAVDREYRITLHLTPKTFMTSSPRWLITLTAMRPDFGFGNGPRYGATHG